MFILLILFLGQIPGTDLKWVFWMGAQALRSRAGHIKERLDARMQERRSGMNSLSHGGKQCRGRTLAPLPAAPLWVYAYVYAIRHICVRLSETQLSVLAWRSHRPLTAWHWDQPFALVTRWLFNYSIRDPAGTFPPPLLVYTLSAVQ